MQIDEQIKIIEEQLKQLKNAYADLEKTFYEKQKHKHFNRGDILTDGNRIVQVVWTENELVDCQYDKGYMGCNIINGKRGFCIFKRDEFDFVKNKEYYTLEHEIKLKLTGLEIEELIYLLGPKNINPCITKTKLLDYLSIISQLK